ncbi:MAG: 4Fe-4S dicluster domain-containing protein [Magnetococcales bacterium]|nr:4Fe-4S dicluster domain-containing protein [Magnetococcales bacterium]
MSDLQFDVIIVGAGPAGLAAAWQLARLASGGLKIAVLEKSARIGGHLLSGALFDPADLPAFATTSPPPLGPAVRDESLHLLTRSHALPVPRLWHHRGCHLLSLPRLARWLASQAEQAGVELYPGFVAADLLWEQDRLVGVLTGDQGRDAWGRPKTGFQPGLALRAPLTILAEGCRGHLTRAVIERLALDQGVPPQTYGLGFKEVWEIPEENASPPGTIQHTLGWPLDHATYGGGFVYSLAADRLAVGWVVGLDYRDPGLDPFLAFQRWKGHPRIRRGLTGGRPVAFGARTLVEGGWQALPRLIFDGGLLVGDGAGFLNAARLKGIGNALHSGSSAAEAVMEAFAQGDFSVHGLRGYPERIAAAAWFADLRAVRNVRPGFRWGLMPGVIHGALEWASRGKFPWTWRWKLADRARLRAVSDAGLVAAAPEVAFWSLDRPAALALSALTQRVDQPAHVQVRDLRLPLAEGRTRFANPETRFCPAGVFEWKAPPDVVEPIWRLHADRCLHCKCCDIKDPLDNLRWTPPEGGGGPDYGAL